MGFAEILVQLLFIAISLPSTGQLFADRSRDVELIQNLNSFLKQIAHIIYIDESFRTLVFYCHISLSALKNDLSIKKDFFSSRAKLSDFKLSIRKQDKE